MVDCILCYAATCLVEQMTDPSNDAGRVMLERVRNDARGSKQVCLMHGETVTQGNCPAEACRLVARVSREFAATTG